MGVVIRFIKKMDTKFSGDVSTLCLLKNLLKIIILQILSLPYIDIQWYWNALRMFSCISYRRSPQMDDLSDSFWDFVKHENFVKPENDKAPPSQSSWASSFS